MKRELIYVNTIGEDGFTRKHALLIENDILVEEGEKAVVRFNILNVQEGGYSDSDQKNNCRKAIVNLYQVQGIELPTYLKDMDLFFESKGL